MSSQKEKPSIIDPAHVEDARQAFAQLTPAERAALGATASFAREFLRLGKSPQEVVDILSQIPSVKSAYDHLAQIPEKPAAKK